MKRTQKAVFFDAAQENLGEQLGLFAERAKELRDLAKTMIEATEAKNPLYLVQEVSALCKTEEELTFIMLNLGFWMADMNDKRKLQKAEAHIKELRSQLEEITGIAKDMCDQLWNQLHDTVLSKLRNSERRDLMLNGYPGDAPRYMRGEPLLPEMVLPDLQHSAAAAFRRHTMATDDYRQRYMKPLFDTVFNEFLRQEFGTSAGPDSKEELRVDAALRQHLAPFAQYIDCIEICRVHQHITIVMREGLDKDSMAGKIVAGSIDRAVAEAIASL